MYNLLSEDIKVTDNDVFTDYYDDNEYDRWSTQNGLPKGYDDDNQEANDFVRHSTRLNNRDICSPELRKAEIEASWNAFDNHNARERQKMMNRAADDRDGVFNNNVYDERIAIENIVRGSIKDFLKRR